MIGRRELVKQKKSKVSTLMVELVGYLPFRILSAKFTKDVVDLILEETSYNPINGKHHIENRYIKLDRNDIATVRFKKH